MRKWGCLACLGSAALFAAILALVFYVTRPAIDCAENFLGHIAEKRVGEAYASASKDFRASTSQPQFEEFCKEQKLDQAQPRTARWGNRRIRSENGWVSGSVSTSDGKEIPLVFQLHWEDGVWKVSSIQTK